jgi:hypothetical protein
VPLAMLGWLSGTMLIWCALFTVGNFLYGRMNYFWVLLAISLVCGFVMISTIRKLWN